MKASTHTLPLFALATVSLCVGVLFAQGDSEDPWPLKVPNPAVEPSPARLKDLSGLACGECHMEIVQEWAGSVHAVSWKDESYQAAIAKRRRPRLCTSCHIPEPILATGELTRPKARETHLHLGVDCDACHRGPGGVLLGPQGIETSAHPTQASTLMTQPGSNELCARCHSTSIGPVLGVAKDFIKAELADKGLSCVGCHMRSIPGPNPEDRPRRSHALQTPRDPAFLRMAFDVRHGGAEDPDTVLVANAAGHRVPGLIGRELRFRLERVDEAGAARTVAEHLLDARVYLALGGEFSLEATGAGGTLRIVGDHKDPRDPDRWVRFMEENLE